MCKSLNLITYNLNACNSVFNSREDKKAVGGLGEKESYFPHPYSFVLFESYTCKIKVNCGVGLISLVTKDLQMKVMQFFFF